MQRCLVVAAVLLVPGLAYADRSTTLSVTGGVALMGDAEEDGPNRMGSALGATLAWDRAPPDFPAPGTARARGDLVPEVTLMAFADRGGILGGLRLELDLAQSKMGLFRNSARASFSIAPRFGLIDGADSPIAGGDFNEVFYLGKSKWHLGITMGVYTWRESGTLDVQTPVAGNLRFRAEPAGSQQLSILMGLIVGN